MAEQPRRCHELPGFQRGAHSDDGPERAGKDCGEAINRKGRRYASKCQRHDECGELNRHRGAPCDRSLRQNRDADWLCNSRRNSECDRESSAAACSACPIPLQFIASRCLPENAEVQTDCCPCARRSDARTPPFGASTVFASAAASTLWDKFCKCSPRLRRSLCSADDAPNAPNLLSKDRIAKAGLRFQRASVQAAAMFDQNGGPRTARCHPQILQCSGRAKRPRMECERIVEKDVQDSGGDTARK